jgi:Divergent InlB B-repeat domain/FG-GAP-like repeat
MLLKQPQPVGRCFVACRSSVRACTTAATLLAVAIQVEAQIRSPAPFSFPTKGELGWIHLEGSHRGVDIWTDYPGDQPPPGSTVHLPYPGQFLRFMRNETGTNIQGVEFYHEIDASFTGLPRYRVKTRYLHMANEDTQEVYANLNLSPGTWYFRGQFIGRQGNQRWSENPDRGESSITHLHIQMHDADTDELLDPSPYLGFALNYNFSHLPREFAFLREYSPSAQDVRWHPDGTVIKAATDPAVYLIHEGKKKHITNPDLLTNRMYGGGWEDIVTVRNSELGCYATGEPIDTAPRLIKGSGPAVYFVFNNRYKRLISGAAFAGIGFAFPRVESVPDSTVSGYPDDPVAPVLWSPYWEGALIKGTQSGAVYIISNGKRRGFTTSSAFEESGFIFSRVLEERQDVVDSMPEGDDIDGAATRNCSGTGNHNLSVTIVGAGSVSTSPAGISCSSGTCTASFPSGTLVQLTVAASAGSTFSGWSGDSDCSDGQLTMSAPRSCTATFSSLSPGAFSKTSPSNGAGGQAQGISLIWQASANATRYEYCFDTTNNNSCGGPWLDAGTSPSVGVSGLQVETTYYWQARAVNGSGTTEANGGSWWSFTTGSSTVAVTIATVPTGRSITVDDTIYTAPQTFNWTAGSSHTIGTWSLQGGGGTRYVFGSWNDGGAMTHSVAPIASTTYTATFETQYVLTTQVSPFGSGAIGRNPGSADGFYTSGAGVQLTATANSGYGFIGWSGDLSGAANPQTVTMNGARAVTAMFAPPPVVATSPAGNVTANGATLNGTVNPNGASTTAVFEYGTTASYGSQVPVSPAPGSGTSPVTVSVSVSGLSCETLYHFRLKATNAAGTATGADATFTTSSCTLPLIVTSFEFPGAVSTSAFGINDAGQIVGSYVDSSGREHGFLKTGSTFTTIDYPGANTTTTRATGINNSGTIVGCYYTFVAPGACYYGFMLSGGTFTTITSPGSFNTTPAGINDNTEIVGMRGFPVTGFLWQGGSFSTIAYPGAASTYASGINDSAAIVGSWSSASGATQGYILERGAFDSLAFPAANSTNASAINEARQVVGNYFIPGSPNRAGGFLWRAGVFLPIDVGLGTVVSGINNSNQIVGWHGFTGTQRGFVATFSGTPVLAHATPASGARGQANLDVLVTGAFTHFVQGATTATFEAGIAINSVTVHNPNQATVNVTISPGTTFGNRTITLTTGSEIASLPNGFAVTQPAALMQVSPGSGQRGRTNLSIALTGQSTHFAQGTTTVSFGHGIVVNSTTVHSPTNATAVITIAGHAVLGSRAVTVTTGAEVVTLTGAFVVNPPSTGDFDADGRADLGVYRPSTGVWYVKNAGTGTSRAFAWGLGSDIPVPGDYDSDGKADVAVYRPSNGAWYVLQSSGNYGPWFGLAWGITGDVPVPADYDGDGGTDVAVYRPSTGVWYILKSSTGFTTWFAHSWGIPGDVPVPADFDGDGKADPAVYRPSAGVWFILKSSASYTTSSAYQGGLATDVPVAADYDGDGKADVAIFRPGAGIWYILKSSTDFTIWTAYIWGIADDVATPGDFDADGKTDLAIYRPSSGHWFILHSTSGHTTWEAHQWGVSTDIPLLRHP